MAVQFNELFPNADINLSNIGFIFGAGTSKEAGYPIMKDLTINVIDQLDFQERCSLEKVLKDELIDYDLSGGTPDIEIILSLLSKNQNNRKYSGIINLEKTIRSNIIQDLLNIKDPNLEHHIKFFSAIKKIFNNTHETIWIFTTNYDILFEMAAMEAKIPIYNGFEGIFNRYFDIERFNLSYGKIDTRFRHFNEPNIKLYKLHGSLSWFKRNGSITEISDFRSQSKDSLSLILPRKEKVLDTLDNPYDLLFTHASRVIGDKCKYLVSCGYSYRDQHINDQLIIPKLRENKIQLIALFGDMPDSIDNLTSYNSFGYVSTNIKKIGKNPIVEQSKCWKFSEFANMFVQKAGL
ncbi:SIR2 family protein [Methanocella sp. MCL-LM]|uniref:SIR2 family protein n=1 Tax=Methanocella sp. MCL-LM TaxID=3412035 RepID=UPI003C735D7A